MAGEFRFYVVMIMVGLSLAIIGAEIRRTLDFLGNPRSIHESGVVMPASVTAFILDLARRMWQVGGLLVTGFLTALLIRSL